MDILNAIFSRRSIRQYTKETISRETLALLVKAGAAAPTARYKRHVRFLVVDDPKLISVLAEGLPNAKMLPDAGHAIVVMSDVSVAYGGQNVPYWIQDCSAATENILISAQALGLGACWTGVLPREERVVFLKKLLKLPEEIFPLCVIAVGMPAVKENGGRDKFSSDCLRWNEWE